MKLLRLQKTIGLTIPIVYNTNSYENIETLKMLEGCIDVYLPDLKYFDDSLANNFSSCKNYFNIAVTDMKYRDIIIPEQYKSIREAGSISKNEEVLKIIGELNSLVEII